MEASCQSCDQNVSWNEIPFSEAHRLLVDNTHDMHVESVTKNEFKSFSDFSPPPCHINPLQNTGQPASGSFVPSRTKDLTVLCEKGSVDQRMTGWCDEVDYTHRSMNTDNQLNYADIVKLFNSQTPADLAQLSNFRQRFKFFHMAAEDEYYKLGFIPYNSHRLSTIPSAFREAFFGLTVCIIMDILVNVTDSVLSILLSNHIATLVHLGVILKIPSNIVDGFIRALKIICNQNTTDEKINCVLDPTSFLSVINQHLYTIQSEVDQIFFRIHRQFFQNNKVNGEMVDIIGRIHETQALIQTNTDVQHSQTNSCISCNVETELPLQSVPLDQDTQNSLNCSKSMKPTFNDNFSHFKDKKCNHSENSDSLQNDTLSPDMLAIQKEKKSIKMSNTPYLKPPTAISVVLRDVTTELILRNCYDARVRVILYQLFVFLNVSPFTFSRIEDMLGLFLSQKLSASCNETKKHARNRKLKIAAAAICGGTILAITAGTAAPGIVAGFSALGIGGAGFATFMSSTGGIAIIASLFGAGGAGLTSWKYGRLIAKIKIFKFLMLNRDHPQSLKITVCVSGALRTASDITEPWMPLCNSHADLYSIKWEPEILEALGTQVITTLSQQFAATASKYWLTYTVAGSLAVALVWPIALIRYASSLDNVWQLTQRRAIQAGILLAEAIMDKQAVGQRPVTLIGYSLGALVIFNCLQTLFKKGHFNAVSDTIVMGLPESHDKVLWSRARSVVAGRLINVHFKTDWLLGFLVRWSDWKIRVAGLTAVQSIQHVENYDVSKLINTHDEYPNHISEILTYVGFDF